MSIYEYIYIVYTVYYIQVPISLKPEANREGNRKTTNFSQSVPSPLADDGQLVPTDIIPHTRVSLKMRRKTSLFDLCKFTVLNNSSYSLSLPLF